MFDARFDRCGLESREEANCKIRNSSNEHMSIVPPKIEKCETWKIWDNDGKTYEAIPCWIYVSIIIIHYLSSFDVSIVQLTKPFTSTCVGCFIVDPKKLVSDISDQARQRGQGQPIFIKYVFKGYQANFER